MQPPISGSQVRLAMALFHNKRHFSAMTSGAVQSEAPSSKINCSFISFGTRFITTARRVPLQAQLRRWQKEVWVRRIRALSILPVFRPFTIRRAVALRDVAALHFQRKIPDHSLE